VAQALEMLTMAGIVQVQPDANSSCTGFSSRPSPQALLWLPSVFPDWSPIFRIIEALDDYATPRLAAGRERPGS